MSQEGLEALRGRVNEDAGLAQRLHAIEPERFVEEVTRLAADLGFSIAPNELDTAIARGRQAWSLRWIL